MSADTLSDVLQAVRLTGAAFFWVEARPPWAAEAPAAREDAAVVAFGAEHVMAYHAVVEGECWGGPLGEPAVRLRAGDVVIFPQGDPHVFSSAPGLRALPPPPPPPPVARPPRLPFALRHGGDAGPVSARFVCGFLGCDARPFNPLLAALPRMLRVASGEGPLRELVRIAVAESGEPRPGGEALLARLSEMMFVEAVRRHLEGLPEEATGWLAGLRDACVGRALAALHARPAHAWTLEELSREAGLSRSALHERFTRLVGQPPMQYLARWRIQLAAGLLARGTGKVAAVALDVGYESEAAFSRAFKRLVGAPPATWRRQRDRARGPPP